MSTFRNIYDESDEINNNYTRTGYMSRNMNSHLKIGYQLENSERDYIRIQNSRDKNNIEIKRQNDYEEKIINIRKKKEEEKQKQQNYDRAFKQQRDRENEIDIMREQLKNKNDPEIIALRIEMMNILKLREQLRKNKMIEIMQSTNIANSANNGEDDDI